MREYSVPARLCSRDIGNAGAGAGAEAGEKIIVSTRSFAKSWQIRAQILATFHTTCCRFSQISYYFTAFNTRHTLLQEILKVLICAFGCPSNPPHPECKYIIK
jgi:hypothetical protein